MFLFFEVLQQQESMLWQCCHRPVLPFQLLFTPVRNFALLLQNFRNWSHFGPRIVALTCRGFFFLLLCITKELISLKMLWIDTKQLKLILSHHFMTWGNFQSVNLPPFTDSLNAIQSQFNLESDWHVSLTVSNIVRAGLDLTHRLVITYPHLDRVTRGETLVAPPPVFSADPHEHAAKEELWPFPQ